MDISWDPMPDPEVGRLPRAVRARMDNLYPRIHTRAAEVLPELRELAGKYPQINCLRNWLCACLRALDFEEEAFQISEATFRENPGYIFGRTTLAEMLLEKGELDEADGIMGGPGAALPFVYPDRKKFHISEVRHWFFIQGKLHVFQDRVESAKSCRDLLHQLEPNSPAVKELDRLLNDENLMMIQLLAGFRRLKKKTRKTPGVAKKTKAAKTSKNPSSPARKDSQSSSGAEQPLLF
jgi:hypothetical protein